MRKGGKSSLLRDQCTATMLLGFSELLLNMSYTPCSGLGLGGTGTKGVGIPVLLELMVQEGETHIARVILDLCGDIMIKE